MLTYHYNIYRSEVSEEYVKIGQTSSNFFVDSDAVAGTILLCANAEDIAETQVNIQRKFLQ